MSESSTAAPCLAVAGYGPWGRNHVRTVHALGSLAAICEVDAERRRAAVAEYPGVTVYATLDEALGDPAVRGVVLATPAETHAALAATALAAGRDVLTEKPLALSVDEARDLVERARQAGRVLMVGHLLEYHPAVVELRRRVAEGAVGALRYVTSSRLNLGRVRQEENVLWSFAPHDVALLLGTVGALPEAVSAVGGSWVQEGLRDEATVRLRFRGGVHGLVHVSWLHPFKEHRLVVVGDTGAIAFEPTLADASLRLWRHRIDWREGRPLAVPADAERLPVAAVSPLEAELRAFLRAIETREPPLTDGPSGVRVLEVLAACERSFAAGGRPVPLAAPAGDVFVHETAIVDPRAEVGEGTRVWHFAHVMAGARVGRRCVLGQNVFVARGAIVGDGCKLQNNVSLYDGVELAEDVFCGPSCVFTNVRRPRAHVERKHAFESTTVGRGATIGANATIVCGTTLGPYAFVAAGAVVTKDVPPHAIVRGAPARVVGWACRCGEALPLEAEGREREPSRCESCGDTYERGADGLERR